MEKLVNDFSFGLFFWQGIILIILIVLLRKFAWKPILDSLNTREEGIKNALESAEKAKQEMANLKADNEKMLQEARADRDEMLKEAQQMKKKIMAEATEDATEKANAIIAKAQETIQSEKKAALSEINEQVATLSLQIAEKVIKQDLSDDKSQMELINKMLEDVKAN
ncbi:F0F1 ATP synthase subunit B [Psychroflexus sp. ALD_RP9]|uniref:F0F1 ATP synthase subunit B n=1 Tax=Psychroflexus sp. ALD_RP9 TaxID=2777186 RepID=UPI001A9063B9|nr:F0F1 ATP synthase subunit B [Psychroflexus sp. ALD_RP9]QSS97929.1 F0F1 ATP synthase subunit B [Psychroflexus sp. ALD_RP9]